MREVTPTARPRLKTQARLQWDPVREKQVLLTPEGVLQVDHRGTDLADERIYDGLVGIHDGEQNNVDAALLHLEHFLNDERFGQAGPPFEDVADALGA